MNRWTVERRARQSELIRTWKPWEMSTGAKTDEGKSRVSKNAWKGNHRQQIRDMTRMVNQEIRRAKETVASIVVA